MKEEVDAVDPDEQQAVYDAYVAQYLAQVAALQAQQKYEDDDKDAKPRLDDMKDWNGNNSASQEVSPDRRHPAAKRPKLESSGTRPSFFVFSSRNIGFSYITTKNVYFYYLKNMFSGSRYPRNS